MHGIKRGMISFGSAPSRMAIRGGLEGDDVRQDGGYGEGNVEVLKNLYCKLCSRNKIRA